MAVNTIGELITCLAETESRLTTELQMELGRKATLYDGVCEQASCILQRMLSEEGVDTQMKKVWIHK